MRLTTTRILELLKRSTRRLRATMWAVKFRSRVAQSCEGDQITLRPLRPKASLKKEQAVYRGESSHASIPDLIDRERATRLREFLG
jgi:hypothetical protein